MEKYDITFRSVTYAQKGERILKAKGMACFLRRTPRWMEARGCGYALEVKNPMQAVKALRDAGAVWEKIYRRTGDRKMEVVEL